MYETFDKRKNYTSCLKTNRCFCFDLMKIIYYSSYILYVVVILQRMEKGSGKKFSIDVCNNSYILLGSKFRGGKE